MNAIVNFLAVVARNSPLGRGESRRLLLHFIDRLRVGSIRTKFRGVPIILHMDNTTERKALLTDYDRREMDFLAAHLTDKDAAYIDVGANSGLYVHWLGAQMAPSARAIAIEPNPVLCERMRANLSLLRATGIEPRVDIFECAAGDQEVTLNLDGCLGSGSLAGGGSGGFPVQVRPLNEIVKQACCSKIAALKIDVEGYEDRVLVPFFHAAPRQVWPKAIVIEYVHSDLWNEDAIAELHRRGYRPAGKTHSNLFFELN